MGLFKKKQKHSNEDIQQARENTTHYQIKSKGYSRILKPHGKEGWIVIWIKDDGSFYFEDEIETVFKATSAKYHLDETKEIIEEVKVPSEIKTKRTGRATGAAIGGLLFGPAGAAVGAAYGTGNTKESPSNYRIEYVNKIVNVPPYVELEAKLLTTGETFTFELQSSIPTLTKIGNEIGFPIIDESSNNITAGSMQTSNLDPYEQIKKLAELKNMGIITEEEFETKKKILLEL